MTRCGALARLALFVIDDAMPTPSATSDPFLPVLRGPRVALRCLTSGDGAAFVAAAAASRELHAEWVSAPSNATAYDAYVARFGARFVPLGAFLHEGGALVGVLNLSEIVLGFFCNAYLGYYAFAPHARKGYIREGLDLVFSLAFEHLGLHRLESNIQPGNTDSIALVRRAGFVREGYSPAYLFIGGAWRDHERWAFRRELWSLPPDGLNG